MALIVGGIVSVGNSNLPTSLGVYVPITLISMALTTTVRVCAHRVQQPRGVRERLVVLNPSRGLAGITVAAFRSVSRVAVQRGTWLAVRGYLGHLLSSGLGQATRAWRRVL